MEKNRSEILSEIQETLALLKARIAEVEEKLAALEAAAEPAEPAPAPVPEAQAEEPAAEPAPAPAPAAGDIPVEDIPVEDFPAEVIPVGDIPAEPVPGDDIPAEDFAPIDISIDLDDVDFPAEQVTEVAVEAEPVAVAEAEPVAVAEAEPVAAPAPVEAPAPEPKAPAAPAFEPEEELVLDEPVRPKASINDRQERNVRKAVMDVMGQKLAWKTAMPGTPVKNVISAISLNDRVLFINTLFKEDPMAFQAAIADFNAMSSFDEAEEYVRTRYPEWNLNSDLVFRLMMAVRRKLR